jgi:hypothetical protein
MIHLCLLSFAVYFALFFYYAVSVQREPEDRKEIQIA